MKRRATLAGVGLLAIAALVSASASGSAVADTAAAAGSASSRTAQVDSGTIAVTPTVTLLGAGLSGLTGLVTTGLVNPLLALPQNLTTALANGLTGAGLSATNPSTQQTRPTSGSFATCGTQGWDSSDCYGPTVPTVNAAGLVTVGTGVAQGYATGDTAGYAAAAQVADPVISLFGVNIGDLGVIGSAAQCDTASNCTATQSLSGGSLFNGALTLAIANGVLVAKVAGVTVGSTSVTVTPTVTATVNGNLLTLRVGLTVDQLLSGIGTTLTALGTLLGGTVSDNGTSAFLTLTIGPGSVSTGTSPSSAWGIDLGVDLTANIKLILTVLGLKAATIGVNAATANSRVPDLTDLKLAYSKTVGGALLPGWISPGLI